jgi:hypothetical protein
MASIEYTPPVLPPPPPAHHPPSSTHRPTPAPPVISYSAQATAHPPFKAAIKEIPLTTRRKRSPLNVVDQNIPLQLLPSLTEAMITPSSEAALLPSSGRVQFPSVAFEGAVVDSAVMVKDGTPSHQDIGAIAIKSNNELSNKDDCTLSPLLVPSLTLISCYPPSCIQVTRRRHSPDRGHVWT